MQSHSVTRVGRWGLGARANRDNDGRKTIGWAGHRTRIQHGVLVWIARAFDGAACKTKTSNCKLNCDANEQRQSNR